MENQIAFEDVVARKAEAEELLRELVAAKKQTEVILAEASRKDLFKRVTGQSSLDNAIAQTSRSIEAYGRVIEDQGVGPASKFCISSNGVPSAL